MRNAPPNSLAFDDTINNREICASSLPSRNLQRPCDGSPISATLRSRCTPGNSGTVQVPSVPYVRAHALVSSGRRGDCANCHAAAAAVPLRSIADAASTHPGAGGHASWATQISTVCRPPAVTRARISSTVVIVTRPLLPGAGPSSTTCPLAYTPGPYPPRTTPSVHANRKLACSGSNRPPSSWSRKITAPEGKPSVRANRVAASASARPSASGVFPAFAARRISASSLPFQSRRNPNPARTIVSRCPSHELTCSSGGAFNQYPANAKCRRSTSNAASPG